MQMLTSRSRKIALNVMFVLLAATLIFSLFDVYDRREGVRTLQTRMHSMCGSRIWMTKENNLILQSARKPPVSGLAIIGVRERLRSRLAARRSRPSYPYRRFARDLMTGLILVRASNRFAMRST